MTTTETPKIDILVAEENGLVREAVVYFLTNEFSRRFRTSLYGTGSGLEALRAIGERNFDVAIVSGRLQGPYNLGTAVISMMRGFYDNLPHSPPEFVLLTTEQFRHSNEAKQLGIPVLEKPFPFSSLVEMVKAGYERRAAGGQK